MARVMRVLVPALLALFLLSSASTAAAPPAIIDSASVGAGPLGAAINPLTNRVYVSNYHDDTVSVIDGATDAVVSTIPVEDGPIAIAVNTATNRIYVTNTNSSSLSVIDGASDTAIGTIGLPLGSLSGTAVSVNPETNRIYVPSIFDNALAVIDGASGSVVDVIDVGVFPVGVDLNTVTNTVYVGNGGEGTVSVVDGATNTVTTTIDLGATHAPMGVGVNPVTNRVFVATFDPASSTIPGTVDVIDGGTEQVLASIPMDTSSPSGGFAQGLKVDPAINKVYVTDSTVVTGALQVIDGMTSTIASTTVLPPLPEGVAVTPQTNRIYVTHGSNPGVHGSVSVLGREGDGDGDEFIDGAELNMGTDPMDVCPDSPAEDAWPPDFNQDTDADIGDVVQAFMGKILNPPNYDPRSDPSGDGAINIGDVAQLYGGGNILSQCTEVTFTNNTGMPVDEVHIEWSDPVRSVFWAQDSQFVSWSNQAFSAGGTVLDIDRPDGMGDLANGGTLTLVVQTPLMMPTIMSCELRLDGAFQGMCY
ncbi:MAG: YncE family protein [Dehalococcoidia bacterium]